MLKSMGATELEILNFNIQFNTLLPEMKFAFVR